MFSGDLKIPVKLRREKATGTRSTQHREKLFDPLWGGSSDHVPSDALNTEVHLGQSFDCRLPTMSAIWGNSENMYSLRVLPHVTHKRHSAHSGWRGRGSRSFVQHAGLGHAGKIRGFVQDVRSRYPIYESLVALEKRSSILSCGLRRVRQWWVWFCLRGRSGHDLKQPR